MSRYLTALQLNLAGMSLGEIIWYWKTFYHEARHGARRLLPEESGLRPAGSLPVSSTRNAVRTDLRNLGRPVSFHYFSK